MFHMCLQDQLFDQELFHNDCQKSQKYIIEASFKGFNTKKTVY